MIIEVETPNGQVIELDVPEGATAGDVQNAIAKIVGGHGQAGGEAPPIPEPVATTAPPGDFGAAPERPPGPRIGIDQAQGLKQFIPREVFTGVGGGIGAAVGAGGGAVGGSVVPGPGTVAGGAAGAVAGGALGAAAGGQIFDTIEDVLEFVGVLEGPRKVTGLLPESAEGAAEELKSRMRVVAGDAVEDAVFSAGVGAGLTAGRIALAKILGVGNQTAKRAAQLARSKGIGVGISDVSTAALARGAPKILGRLPFIGTPFRSAAARRAGEAAAAGERILSDFGPHVSLARVGVNAKAAAAREFKAFRTMAGARYTRFRELAAAADVKDIVPSESIIKRAQEIADPAGKIILKNQKVLKGEAGQQTLFEFIENLKNLPENISVEQFRTLSRQLDGFADAAERAGRGSDFAVIINPIRESMELALNKLDVSRLPEGQGREILDALVDANTFYRTGIVRFQTATAKKFGRVDRRIFGPGPQRAGSIEADEVVPKLLNVNSPQAIRNFRSVVGETTFKRARAAFLNDIFERSTTTVGGQRIVDPSAIEAALGLTGKNAQARRAVLEELSKGSPVRGDDVLDFLEAAKIAFRSEAPDVSTFLARRAAIGGDVVAGLAGGGLVAGAGGLGFKAVGLILLTRLGSRALASPRVLKALQATFDETLSAQMRRANVVRLAKMITGESKLPEE